MMWLLLFAGLLAYVLGAILPAPSTAVAARVLAAVLFGVGLILAIIAVA